MKKRANPVDPNLPAAIADEIGKIVRREIAAALDSRDSRPAGEPSYPIRELAAAEGISRAKMHDILKTGRGPAVIRPSAQVVRITAEARREWHRQLEQEAAEAAKEAGETVKATATAATKFKDSPALL
jgi:hypothetical protein